MDNFYCNQCKMVITNGAPIPPYHLKFCKGESLVYRSSSNFCNTCHTPLYHNMNPPEFHIKHIRQEAVARAEREQKAINKLYAIDNREFVVNRGEFVPLPEMPSVTVPKKLLQMRASKMNQEARMK